MCVRERERERERARERKRASERESEREVADQHTHAAVLIRDLSLALSFVLSLSDAQWQTSGLIAWGHQNLLICTSGVPGIGFRFQVSGSGILGFGLATHLAIAESSLERASRTDRC